MNEDFEQVKKTNEILLSAHRRSPIVLSTNLIWWSLCLLIFTSFGLYLPQIVPLVYAIPLALVTSSYFIFKIWYLYTRTAVLITNMRVVAFIQKGIFFREKHEIYLSDICQISAQIKGLRQSMFNFGDVLVQTEKEMWLEDIEKPYEVNDALFNALRQKKHGEFQALPSKFWNDKRHADKLKTHR